MKRMEHLSLHVTPLTPIHVGAGIDLDPTGYVIDDDALFVFDPARVPLQDSDRRALLAAVKLPGDDAVLAVQRFFHERREACAGAAGQVLSVAPGLAAEYGSRVGRVAQRNANGTQRVINQLVIERTVHHPHTGVAYVPGSSLKGAMRTAWLDGVNRGRAREGDERPAKGEARLLEGSFHTDPFRLLRVGDAHGTEVASQVLFSTNHKKRQVFRDGRELAGQGPSVRRECIAAAQYAALGCEVQLDSLADLHAEGLTPTRSARMRSWHDLTIACNRYYVPRLRRELSLLAERRFAADSWLAEIEALLDRIAEALGSGTVMLLRVGRHSGAESVTLDGWRNIRIMRGRGEQPRWSTEGATTIWLAAQSDGQRSDMQPFGWALLHDAQMPLAALETWCGLQPKPALVAARTRLLQARDRAAAEASRVAALEAERRQREAERERAEAARAALSAEGRLVDALGRLLESHTAVRKQSPGGQLYQETRRLIAAADQGAWSPADCRRLAELLEAVVPTKIDLGNKAREIKAAAQRLRERSADGHADG